jgi:hypothetical protein
MVFQEVLAAPTIVRPDPPRDQQSAAPYVLLIIPRRAVRRNAELQRIKDARDRPLFVSFEFLFECVQLSVMQMAESCDFVWFSVSRRYALSGHSGSRFTDGREAGSLLTL